MNFRHLSFPILLCVSGLVIAAETGTEKLAVPSRPHIVLVMSDDQGWGDVGYNGHPILQTPHLDSAAASGLRLDQFYAAAPSCSPTRASVLTGRHPNRMGVFAWGLPIRPQEITLAEILHEEGYTTGHFGKWHLGSVRADSPVNPGRNGFDRWFSSTNFYDNNPVMSDEGHEVKIEGESSAVAVDAALEWIAEQAHGEAPIFAVVWFGSPHLPHRSDPKYSALYSDQSKKDREFLGEVTGIDEAFGSLRDGLEELGIREKTLLWFTSDNGALHKVGSTGGYRGGKSDVYEGGLRVPALIEWPEVILEPRSSSIRGCTTDILPTILEIVGISSDSLPVLDGISLLPLIRDEMASRETPIGFWNANIPGHFTNPVGPMKKMLPTLENWSDRKVKRVTHRVEKLPRHSFPPNVFPGHAAWIAGEWKLHRISMADGQKVKWELYNLVTDPRETRDVSKSNGEIVSSLKPDLETWLRSVVRSLNGDDYAVEAAR